MRLLSFIVRAVLLVAFALTVTAEIFAQSGNVDTAPNPAFEVASIKQDKSGRGGGNWDLSGPYISATNVPLKNLIERAYGMEDFQTSGGPAWISSERFDVEAKLDDSMVARFEKLSRDQKIDQVRPMLQKLLADRFKLKVTRGTKELPIFALVLTKDDSKLKAFAVDPYTDNAKGLIFISSGRGGQKSIQAIHATLLIVAGGLAISLSSQVLDRTNVKGNYSFTIRWTDDAQLPTGASPDPAYDRTLAAGLQEELGLKLKPSKGPVETISIDHIEEPTPN